MERLAISFSEVLQIHDLMFGAKCVRLSPAARRSPSAKSVFCRKEREEREREGCGCSSSLPHPLAQPPWQLVPANREEGERGGHGRAELELSTAGGGKSSGRGRGFLSTADPAQGPRRLLLARGGGGSGAGGGTGWGLSSDNPLHWCTMAALSHDGRRGAPPRANTTGHALKVSRVDGGCGEETGAVRVRELGG
jgi:hypothetical protein